MKKFSDIFAAKPFHLFTLHLHAFFYQNQIAVDMPRDEKFCRLIIKISVLSF